MKVAPPCCRETSPQEANSLLYSQNRCFFCLFFYSIAKNKTKSLIFMLSVSHHGDCLSLSAPKTQQEVKGNMQIGAVEGDSPQQGNGEDLCCSTPCFCDGSTCSADNEYVDQWWRWRFYSCVFLGGAWVPSPAGGGVWSELIRCLLSALRLFPDGAAPQAGKAVQQCPPTCR